MRGLLRDLLFPPCPPFKKDAGTVSERGKFIAVLAILHRPTFFGEFVAELVGGGPVLGGAGGPASIGEGLDFCGDVGGVF